MSFTGLLAGAFEGFTRGGVEIADARIKEQADERKRTLDLQATYAAMDRKLATELGAEQTKRDQRVGTVNRRLGANADERLDQVYGQPVAGETPLTDDQQAVQSEGLRLQRIERERDKQTLMRRPDEMLRAAVETGYESPDKLVGNDTKLALAEAKRQADAERQRAQVEIALAKLELSTTGKPPSGYRQTTSGNLEAIPGGPADTKLQGVMNADTAALSGSIGGLDRLADATNRLLTHPGLDGITGLRGKIPNIPGGDAANASALLDTLKSQIGFSVLQSLRDASKTGGALGNVSDKEGARLEANLAALDRAQSAEQFRQSLGQILEFTEQAKGRVREAYNFKHGDKAPGNGSSFGGAGASGAPKITSRAQLDQLPSGTLFTAPDGTVRRKP